MAAFEIRSVFGNRVNNLVAYRACRRSKWFRFRFQIARAQAPTSTSTLTLTRTRTLPLPLTRGRLSPSQTYSVSGWAIARYALLDAN